MSVEIQKSTHKVSSIAAGKEGWGSGVPMQLPRGLRIGFWFCIAVAIAVVLRRVLALSNPPNSQTALPHITPTPTTQ